MRLYDTSMASTWVCVYKRMFICCLWVVTRVIDKTPLCLNPPHFPPLPRNVNSLHHRNVIPNPLICLDCINIFQLKLPFSPSYCMCLFFFFSLLLLFSCLFIAFSIRTKLEAISWQTDALQFRSGCELELGVLWARWSYSQEILAGWSHTGVKGEKRERGKDKENDNE